MHPDRYRPGPAHNRLVASARSAPATRHRHRAATGTALLLAGLWLAASPPAGAQTGQDKPASTAGHRHNSKLLLTGGVSTIEGAAGGGMVPWAVTGGYATGHAISGTAHLTRVRTGDYALTGYGAAVAYGDRAELSIAHQNFDTGITGTALGLPGLRLKQNILGLKLRLAGDAVLDADTWMPQIALGLQYKDLDAGGLAPTLAALGAKTSGTDVYLSATKLFLAHGLLVNGTLRLTKANQGGLLGFGGSARSGYSLQPEFSVAYLLRRDLAIGAEYRFKPDNLNPAPGLGDALREDDWKDVFLAWAPNKNFSLTAAYVDLGRIVPGFAPKRQTGAYLSAQIAY